jgi:hypothetical protein
MACDRFTTHKSTDDNAPVCFVFNYSANAATAAEETEAVTGQAHGATARQGGEERPRALLVDAAILLMRRACAQVRLAKGRQQHSVTGALAVARVVVANVMDAARSVHAINAADGLVCLGVATAAVLAVNGRVGSVGRGKEH